MRSKHENHLNKIQIEVEPEFLSRISSLISTENEQKKGEKSSILQEIESFHAYYSKRYQQLKANFERVNKQNWQYANKLLQYEQKFEQYQQTLFIVSKKAQSLQTQVGNLSDRNQRSKQNSDFQIRLKEKQNQIEQLKWQLSENKRNLQRESKDLKQSKQPKQLKQSKQSKQLRQSKQPKQSQCIERKTVIKRHKKQQNEFKKQSDGISNAQSSRIHYKMTILRQQNEQLKLQNSELLRQMDLIRKRVKSLQANKKYEDDRLKSATLALELDLEMKNQQIQRLSAQIQIYQKKFAEVIQISASNSSIKEKRRLNKNNLQNYSVLNLQQPQKENKRLFLDDSMTPSNNYCQKLVHDASQQTQKKLDLHSQIVRGKHRRNNSSNLQNYEQRQKLQMKVKIFKFDRNKRKA